MNAGFGVADAACGGDILFVQAMMRRGHINIVLPFGADEFVKTSVAVRTEGGWPARFQSALEPAIAAGPCVSESQVARAITALIPRKKSENGNATSYLHDRTAT